MTKRSPIVVFLLTCITFFIYGIYWFLKTGGELKAKGADIPHWILFFIPIVGLYWLWQWACGVEKATGGTTSGAVAFVLVFLLGPIGMAVVQSKFNSVA